MAKQPATQTPPVPATQPPQAPPTRDSNSPPSSRELTTVAPPSALTSAPLSEAAQAFLQEVKGPREVPKNVPIIRINHQENCFVLPSGELVPRVSGYPVYYFQNRRYYKQAYRAGDKGKPPDCWSADMVRPHESSTDTQADYCARCPMNAFGTGRDGRSKACAAFTWTFLLNPDFGRPPIGVVIAPPSSIKGLIGTTFKQGYFAKAQARDGVYETTWTTFQLLPQGGGDGGVQFSVIEAVMGPAAKDIGMVQTIAKIRNEFIAAMEALRQNTTDTVDVGDAEES